MNISKMQPQDLFYEDWIDTYIAYITILDKQILRLNTYLHICQEMESFPFKFLNVDNSFWVEIELPLLNLSYLTLWRVACDQSDQGLSLNFLKNEIFKHLKDKNLKFEFREILKKRKFEQKIAQMKPKVEGIRNLFLAHFGRKLMEDDIDRFVDLSFVSLADIRKYRNSVENYFKILCFGYIHKWYDSEKDRYVSIGKRLNGHRVDVNNIEDVFCTLARSSEIFYYPETKPAEWSVLAQSRKYWELWQFNRYRKLCGLSTIEISN